MDNFRYEVSQDEDENVTLKLSPELYAALSACLMAGTVAAFETAQHIKSHIRPDVPEDEVAEAAQMFVQASHDFIAISHMMVDVEDAVNFESQPGRDPETVNRLMHLFADVPDVEQPGYDPEIASQFEDLMGGNFDPDDFGFPRP
jgi:hypothetical protein